MSFLFAFRYNANININYHSHKLYMAILCELFELVKVFNLICIYSINNERCLFRYMQFLGAIYGQTIETFVRCVKSH